MSIEEFLKSAKKFFSEDTNEIIGTYFDGEMIFIARLTQNLETIEVKAQGAQIEQLAGQISDLCKKKGWDTSTMGFCLRQEDAVTFQTEILNIPEKDIPALVKSWAIAQAGVEAKSSFTKIGEELWMETLPNSAVQEYFNAFKKFGMNLRALSVMPDMQMRSAPHDSTGFIVEVIRNKSAPNLLTTQGSVWHWQKISQVLAAGILFVLAMCSLKLFIDYNLASDNLNAAKISIENLNEELALKKTLDETVDGLHRINNLAVQVDESQNFNLLINLGKIADKSIRLTKIRAENNLLELEGVAVDSEALKIYLGRVRNYVVPSARLESSLERDDEIVFVIRASLK